MLANKKVLIICVLTFVFSLLLINRIANICYLNYNLNEDVEYIELSGTEIKRIFKEDKLIIDERQKIDEIFNSLNAFMLLPEKSKIAYVNYFPTTDELDQPLFYRVMDFVTNDRLKFIDDKGEITIIQHSKNGTEIGEIDIINDYYISTGPAGKLFKLANKGDSFVRALRGALLSGNSNFPKR